MTKNALIPASVKPAPPSPKGRRGINVFYLSPPFPLAEGLGVRILILSFVIWILSFNVAAAFVAPPQRIISGMPVITEMLFALNLADRVIGVTSNCNYPEQARKKEIVGGFFLNLEKVVSLKPDLIILQSDAQKRDVQKFRRFGLAVYTIEPHSVKDVMSTILELGAITDQQTQAKKIVQNMQVRLSKIKVGFGDILARKKVLVLVGFNPLIVAGQDTFVDDILRYAGVDNIGAQVRGQYPQYSLEKLVNENPDCLIIPQGLIDPGKLKQDKRWQSIAAVKNNKVLFVDADKLSRPGPRVVDVVEEIAAFVHQP